MKRIRLELHDQYRVWDDPEEPDRLFVDLTYRFTRSLTVQEKNQAIAHFVNGLDRLDTAGTYSLQTVDFSSPDMLQLTFEYLELDIERVLLQLIVRFRNTFPVQPSESLVDLDLLDLEDLPDRDPSKGIKPE